MQSCHKILTFASNIITTKIVRIHIYYFTYFNVYIKVPTQQQHNKPKYFEILVDDWLLFSKDTEIDSLMRYAIPQQIINESAYTL